MSIFRDPGGAPTPCAGIAPVSPRLTSLYHTPRGPKGRGGTVKRSACLALAGIFVSPLLPSMTYYVLELRGGSHIYATGEPVRRGRVTLFRRYPDGVYMSLSSDEILKVEAAQEPPRQTETLAPGSTLYIGSALFGPARE